MWQVTLNAGEVRTGVDFAFDYRGPSGQDLDTIEGRLLRIPMATGSTTWANSRW